jgi:hypothetical protein
VKNQSLKINKKNNEKERQKKEWKIQILNVGSILSVDKMFEYRYFYYEFDLRINKTLPF